jgi:hypothetical protein
MPVTFLSHLYSLLLNQQFRVLGKEPLVLVPSVGEMLPSELLRERLNPLLAIFPQPIQSLQYPEFQQSRISTQPQPCASHLGHKPSDQLP